MKSCISSHRTLASIDMPPLNENEEFSIGFIQSLFYEDTTIKNKQKT